MLESFSRNLHFTLSAVGQVCMKNWLSAVYRRQLISSNSVTEGLASSQKHSTGRSLPIVANHKGYSQLSIMPIAEDCRFFGKDVASELALFCLFSKRQSALSGDRCALRFHGRSSSEPSRKDSGEHRNGTQYSSSLYRSTVLRHRSALTRPWASDRADRLGPGLGFGSRAAR